jgi:AraC-like DNA-binding protein
MSFMYEERPSDSPFVDTVWHTQSDIDGSNIVVADGSWDIQIRRQRGLVSAVICGATSKAAPVPYTQGSECIGIRFKLGTFMPLLPATIVRDVTLTLPNATRRSFWLWDLRWHFPTYDNVELFVDKLVHNGLLIHDEVVDEALQDQQQNVSVRSVQRRFLRATGLTQSYILKIERARHAAALLREGLSILEAVEQAGYFDQSHMTRSLKQLIGYTPAQLFRENQA